MVPGAYKWADTHTSCMDELLNVKLKLCPSSSSENVIVRHLHPHFWF
jgi:hypothetical protein